MGEIVNFLQAVKLPIMANPPIITHWGTCAPGEYRFRHHLVDRQSPIVVDSHKIEY